MNIKINKATLASLLVAILAVAAYWYWSPYLAVRQMQAAAKAGDADAFNDHVDYPKLRESFKGQFSAILVEQMGNSKNSENPFAALGSMLGLAMVDKVVDALVRPETVMRGMQSGKFGPKAQQPESEAATTSGTPASKEERPRWAYDRKSANKLIAYAKDDTGSEDKKVGIVFERSGFANWKLTEIRMPSMKP